MRSRKPPFFIVGAERSGTTMLRLMLNAHPEVAIPPETWFLIDLMNRLPLTDVLTETQQRLAWQLVIAHKRWPDLDIPNNVLHDRIIGLRQPRLADVIDAIYAELLLRTKKRRWGDKTPEYVIEIDRLHRVFPAAQFVHIIRDARDVSLSLMKKRWRGTFTVNAARYWGNYVSRGCESGRRLADELYLEVHYEDIVCDPPTWLQRICAFLRLEYTDAMMRFHETATEKIPVRERPFHSDTSRTPRVEDVERWRTEATPLQIMSVEGVAGSIMDRLGQTRHYRGLTRVAPTAIGVAEAMLWGVLRVRRKLLRLNTPQTRAGAIGGHNLSE
jgi:hypothetical protein